MVLLYLWSCRSIIFFCFTDTATTEIYTLSLHDALPISDLGADLEHGSDDLAARHRRLPEENRDRKSTRLNSSHTVISYAVFCLKKKKKKKTKPKPQLREPQHHIMPQGYKAELVQTSIQL